MTLRGKGFFIWKIPNCENGDPVAIANVATQAGLSHVLIKIADGVGSYNVDLTTGVDLVPPVIQELRARSIEVWGWHYIYGYDPVGEANKAIQRMTALELDGYVVDAEREFKESGKAEAARTFMNRVRTGLPDTTIALSSYRFPSFHPQFPFRAFLEKCDLNMPQVYWLLNHNPGEQLLRTLNEFQAITPVRPVIPTGSAFKQGSWSPTTADMLDFLQTARSLNMTAANFWEWANCRTNLPDIWNAIKDYEWPVTPPPLDIAQRYIQALNSRDPDEVIAFYLPNALHVTSARTLTGSQNIRNWYSSLFSTVLPGASFTLTSFTGTGNTRYLSWTARSSAGNVLNGSDTFGLLSDLIAYHYTFFTVSR